MLAESATLTIKLLDPEFVDDRFDILSPLVDSAGRQVNLDHQKYKGKDKKDDAKHEQNRDGLRYFQLIQSLQKHTQYNEAHQEPAGDGQAYREVTEPAPKSQFEPCSLQNIIFRGLLMI